LSLVAALLSTLAVGCSTIPTTPPYAPGVGVRSCRNLAKMANDRSTEEFITGAVVAIAGATGVVSGMLLGPDTGPDAAWYEKSGYLFVIAPSAVVAAVGVGMMSHAQRTGDLGDRAAAIVNEGKNEPDWSLYYECVSARGDWSGDHSDLAKIQTNLVKEHLPAESPPPQTQPPPPSSPAPPVVPEHR
jgi:hypothetical protein